MHDTEERLTALEMRSAHQELAIDDLNAALIAQGQAIDRMRRELAGLRDRLSEAEGRAAPAAPVEQPPPHY